MNRGLTISNLVYDVFVVRNTKDCKTFLDLGVGRNSGSDSIMRKIPHTYSVGVDIYRPYLEACPEKKVHSELVCEDLYYYLCKCDDNSFDAVLLLDVLEHMVKPKAKLVLSEAIRVAKKKVIVSTPNGFQFQAGYEENVYQNHLCGIYKFELEKLGFVVKRLHGFKNFFFNYDVHNLLGVYKK